MPFFESFYDESERLFDRAVDRKERLVQTYIVVSGLLVACYQQLPTSSIYAFYMFLAAVISYYVELSRIRLPDVSTNALKLAFLNFLGMISAATFAYLVVDFVKHIYSDSNLYFSVLFFIMTLTVIRSLWLNYPEFTPRKTNNVEK